LKLDERGQIISEAFSRAISLIDEVSELGASSEISRRKLLLWKAAAEAEYLAFQISFHHGLIDYEPKKSAETSHDQDTLDQARTLLLRARSSIGTDERIAYEAVRGAVSILRSAYANEEKTFRPRDSSSTGD
jgi:hypothetical protein